MGIGGGGGGGGGTQADKPKINDATAAYRIEYFIAQPPSCSLEDGVAATGLQRVAVAAEHQAAAISCQMALTILLVL
jgi:hypothetical protein